MERGPEGPPLGLFFSGVTLLGFREFPLLLLRPRLQRAAGDPVSMRWRRRNQCVL